MAYFMGREYVQVSRILPRTMTMRSKAYVYNLLIAGVAGSSPDEGMNVRVLCLLCVV